MRLSLPFSLGGICNRDALSCVVREDVLPKKIKNYFLYSNSEFKYGYNVILGSKLIFGASGSKDG